MNDIYSFHLKTLNGKDLPLEQFRGKVMLIVNTASHCGFTPQYRELESLYQQYKEQGFCILACPCDQFGHQEPGNADEIQHFCSLNYDISFPLSEKIHVNGSQTHPLYQHLKAAARGVMGTQSIKWNFTKFLIDRQGKVIKRYGSMIPPKAIQKDIERLMA